MTAVDITKQIHKLGCQQKLKDYLQHPAVESQAAAYQVCLKFWLWISFNLLTRLNHPDQAQTEKLEMTALLSILFPFFLSLVVGIGNYICNYTNISGLSMAKKKFKTAKSRDFPHVCIKREKLGLLPSYVMTLSFLARQKKNNWICRMLCMHQEQELSTSRSIKRIQTSVSQVLPSQQCRNMSKLWKPRIHHTFKNTHTHKLCIWR